MGILKSIFSPVQEKVLSKKLCPACTRKLDASRNRKILSSTKELVRCACGRYFVYNAIDQRYKRASEGEVLRITGRIYDSSSIGSRL